jgi:hypothetical protein
MVYPYVNAVLKKAETAILMDGTGVGRTMLSLSGPVGNQYEEVISAPNRPCRRRTLGSTVTRTFTTADTHISPDRQTADRALLHALKPQAAA